MGNKRRQYSSWLGTILSILIYALVSLYAARKFMIMWEYDDTSIQISTEKPPDADSRSYRAEEIDFDITFGIV